MSSEEPNSIETIVCLANSRKISGRCVAGKHMGNGSWFRPISDRPGHELSELDLRYSDGSSAQLLDIIEIPCMVERPQGHQSENVLIDNRFYWEKKGRASWDNIIDLLDPAENLWANGFSAYYNQNNRVPEERIDPVGGSLRLIEVNELILNAGPKAPNYGDMKPIVRASFEYRGEHYKLDVTDPKFERACLEKGPGEYRLNSVIICISLSEPHTNKNGDTFAYKLVASIITKKRAGG